MKINAMSFHDYRVYAGRQSMRLAPPDSSHPVVLIGGMNGEGKTTLLEGLQLALFGRQSELWQTGGLSYPDYLRQSIHRAADPKSGAMVEVEFEAPDHGVPHTFKVQRSWKVSGSDKLVEYVQVFRDGELDRLLSEEWAEQVERFMPSRLAGLFFFDGEKIKHYADPERSRELVQLGVTALLGIDLIDQLDLDLKAMELRVAKAAQADNGNPELLRTDARLTDLRAERERLLEQRAKLMVEQDRLMKQLAEADKRYRDRGGVVYEERQGLIQSEKLLRKRLDDVCRALIGVAGGALPLALIVPLVRDVMKQANLESEVQHAQSALMTAETLRGRLLAHLAEAGVEEKTGEIVHAFLVREYDGLRPMVEIPVWLRLGENDRALLDRLFSSDLATVRDEARKLIREFDSIDSELVRLSRKLAVVPDAEAMASLQIGLDIARKDFAASEGRMAQLDDDLRRIDQQIVDGESTLAKLVMKIYEVRDDSADDARVLEHADKVRGTLRKFRAAIIKQRLASLEEATAESFVALMRKGALVSKITIDADSFALRLFGRDEREVAAEWLSAGERQLLVVAILWGLARASGRTLPVIIDTPLGRLDSEHRDNLVRFYFPRASHQVILLSTDEEIVGHRLVELAPYLGHKYRLVYDESKDATHIELGYFKEARSAT